MRGLWLKIWIASQPRSWPRSTAFSRPPAVETCAPTNMDAILWAGRSVPAADTHRRRTAPLWKHPSRMNDDATHRYRFAPSPTGALHIGGARTALYNWLAARHAPDGRLILRIEDTDRERSTKENEDQIEDALRWLGITIDEGPISQFGRADRHEAVLAQLVASGAAYRDPATAKDVEAWKAEHGAGRGYRGTPSEEPGAAIRLRVPDDGTTIVDDIIHGPVSFPNAAYDDFVIARADGTVLYNFAVAVDD